ncbi:Peptidoglycan-associated lipoprotein [Arenibacter antarcticus]|uniref:OmpA family protein n=1 Tax=Arenibacter antarcticus TaxID=2040469 RepID=A0ABW5VL94_9FLAO|nr:OmpA family protein [Arenibacter sp. H213]MCM4167049.1 OmpA family protein [Arenibacter sp. H213]
MRLRKILPKVILCGLLMFSFSNSANGQFLKKLGKIAEKAAERTVERRVDKEVSKKTDDALDDVLEPGSNAPNPESNPAPNHEGSNTNSTNTSGEANTPANSVESGPKTLKFYTNYDFVAGNKVLMYDDFSVDNIGDFPAKWNTNGSGEVVTFDNSPDKWVKLSNKTSYIPDLPEILPSDFTVEFDMITTGLDKEINSYARLTLILDDNNTFRHGYNYAEMGIPLAQYMDAGIYLNNRINGQNTVRNNVKKDVRNDILQLAHVAIAVNGQRFRMWMNERKLVDLPRFIGVDLIKYLKFNLDHMPNESNGQFVFITNVKVAEGGEDLRSKLLKEGKFSTTGILFDSGSDKIKPESYGTLKEIAIALQQESGINVQIVGHTDADGSDATNVELSKKRAASVKKSLSSDFGIMESRLQTDGKGEAEPVGDNNTTAGKAQNRRVEFIKT